MSKIRDYIKESLVPDIASISTALASIKSATDIAKYISTAGLTLEKAELKLKFAELVGSLADAKLEIADIQNLILEKDDLIKSLKQKLERKDKVVFQNRVYWIKTGSENEGPYCQRCYDVDGLLVRVQPKQSRGNDRTHRWYYCAECETSYDIE